MNRRQQGLFWDISLSRLAGQGFNLL